MINSVRSLVVWILLLAGPGGSLPVALAECGRLPVVTPEVVGVDEKRLEGLAQIVNDGITAGKMPGCVICVGRHGKIFYRTAFGQRQVAPESESMTVDTVFDLASLTKPIATGTSVMKLIESGRMRLNDRVVKYLPEFSPNGKDAILIVDLLTHQSGLIPDNPLSDYEDGPETAWKKICALKLQSPVGTKFSYSDVNFIVLGKLVEQISGKSLDVFSAESIFAPSQMKETGFNPPPELRSRAAPTEQRNGQWIRGEVHDPRAYLLGGVAGHAGLFSTADDLAIYAQMLLNRGRISGDENTVRILHGRTVELMTRGYPVSSGLRGLAWDKMTGYSSNRGDLLSPAAFGHGGFTGTVMWIDPELDLFFIFLSNRLHPDGVGSVNHLAGQVLNRIVSSIVDEDVPRANLPVLTGIDVLEREQFRRLEGQRVGLITNHTGRTADGRSTIEVMAKAKNANLRVLFSPEHGLEGKLDIPKIDDGKDDVTGLKVFSLYGETRKPTPEMLTHVDTLVFDIQDIGTRFYTYISTMGEAMIAAAEHGKRFVVLDRPNPIGGVDVAGPMLDRGKESFVGFHHLPVRHGMTIGEIAQMIQQERGLQIDLRVVPCEEWQRRESWDETQLTWIDPSPNMRRLNAAFLYPGIGLLETTNISVGRGTDTPFEIIGAPWIDGRRLARHLNERRLPGVRFVPIQFTPSSSKHAGELCHGVNVVITNRRMVRPVRIGMEIATALRKLFREDWEIRHLNRLLGNDEVFRLIAEGADVDVVHDTANKDLRSFLRRRQPFLLYE